MIRHLVKFCGSIDSQFVPKIALTVIWTPWGTPKLGSILPPSVLLFQFIIDVGTPYVPKFAKKMNFLRVDTVLGKQYAKSYNEIYSTNLGAPHDDQLGELKRKSS